MAFQGGMKDVVMRSSDMALGSEEDEKEDIFL